MFEKIAVIGAGTMGRGIAVDLVLHRLRVVLVDVDPVQLERARAEIANTVRFAPLLNPKAAHVAAAEATAAVDYTTELEAVADCDFVVENIPEKLELKAPLYRRLEALCPPEVCFGVDTSCLSITRIASLTARPDKVVGMHFMNPVFMKPVVEVMRGTHTSQATLDACCGLLAQLGKQAIIVGDLPGFVSNRVSHLFMNEAMWVVQDGVATPEQVDGIFKACFGHKMGPLETADLIGLDVVLDSLNVLYESYQDPKFRCCPLLRRMVEAGNLGRKSGQGFFPYSNE